METLWFWLVAMLLTGYVVLDGFDLGAGMVSLISARTEEERGHVIRAIGPYWDGNEVWLVTGGATLFFAFPSLYASSFSGFYLPLMMFLWLLMLRGISIEFRNHIDSPVWKPMWDVVFALSSALLALVLGVALGNVVRGVPLDRAGDFFLPLWTHWGIRDSVGILDWYTILVGLLAFATLLMHGALWVKWKTAGALQRRTRGLAGAAAICTALLTALVTIVTFRIQPLVPSAFAQKPWGWIFPVLAISGIVVVFWNLGTPREAWAFLGSCLFIVGMMTSVAFGLFPYVLPTNGDPANGLTIWNTAAAGYGLRIGLAWWIPGMALVFVYFFFLYRRFAGKVGESTH